jgi:excisionase family DNA binding protein
MNIMQKKNLDNWLTTKDAATRVGVTDGYIRQLVRSNSVNFIQPSERVLLIEKRSLDAYFDTPKVTGRPRKNAPQKDS